MFTQCTYVLVNRFGATANVPHSKAYVADMADLPLSEQRKQERFNFVVETVCKYDVIYLCEIADTTGVVVQTIVDAANQYS